MPKTEKTAKNGLKSTPIITIGVLFYDINPPRNADI